jgi:membrane-bound ClpP family serine protease
MTTIGVSLMVIGALVIVAEAHVPTLGLLGGPGVLALAIGAVLAVSGLGGGAVLGAVTALVLVAVGASVVGLSIRKGMAVRRRRVRAGPERLIGRIGIVHSWTNGNGKVQVDGALWQARRGLFEDEDPVQLRPGDPVVVDQVGGLTLRVRPAEEWELTP